MNRESLLFMRLTQVQRQLLSNSAEVLTQFDLTNAQYDILNHLNGHDGCSQKELAQTLLVTKGNITQIITKMEKLGLVARKLEWKTKYIFLTPTGKELYQAVTPKLEQSHKEALAGLTGAEQKQLLKLLKQILKG